jgi:hypothetical protein
MSKTAYSGADRVKSNILCVEVCSQLTKSSIVVGSIISCKVPNLPCKIIAFEDLPYYRCLIQSCMKTFEMLYTKQRHFEIPNFVDPMTDESQECSMIWSGPQITGEMYWKGGFTELLDN